VTAASPCIGFCRLDAAALHCLGCARTGAEIAAWRDAPPTFLDRVWAELPARRERLGVRLHRLAWTPGDLLAFVAGTLTPGGGTWAFGPFGGASEFRVDPGGTAELERPLRNRLVVRTPRVAARFDATDQVRVLTPAAPGEDPARGPLVLAVPRPRHASRPGLAALGPDRDAIEPAGRDARLYDLGLPTRGAAFCLRTGDPDLIRALDDCLGMEWPDLFAGIGRRIVAASPTRVILSPFGRVEARGPIAGPGDGVPLGPIQLAGGRDVPVGLEPPEALAACASYFPEGASLGGLAP